MPRKTPRIREKKDYLFISDVVIGLKYGMCLRPCVMFYKEARRYGKKKIFLEVSNYRTPVDDILGLVGGGFYRGMRVTILAKKDLGEKAEEALTRMYNGLTSRTFLPDLMESYLSTREYPDDELLID